MAYRSPAEFEPPARRAALSALSDAIDAATGDLAQAREELVEARRRLAVLEGDGEARVSSAEEQRRRALLLSLAAAKQVPQSDGLRAALHAERRERDLRAALTRARRALCIIEAPSPAAATSAPLDVDSAHRALLDARQLRAAELAPAFEAQRAAAALVREAEERLDELERERLESRAGG